MTGQKGSPSLSLRLLGPPQIERDGEPIEVDTRKAVALAAYLATTGRKHRRESLGALLWPEYDAERAYANLRRTLWSLNKALGPEWLEADQETIALRRGPGYWADVDAFRAELAGCREHAHPRGAACAGCQASLARAVDLYRGDFLAGFTLRDSACFDEWQALEAEELRLALAAALEQLVACLATGGNPEAALEYARRGLALDPFHEAAHRDLMRLYAQAGHRAAALRQYEQLAHVLDEELGAVPDEETEALRAAIQAGRLPPVEGAMAAAPPAGGPVNLPPQPTPFVGREDELDKIEALLSSKDCRLLTLVGPGGTGKTRLALEVAARQAAAFQHGVHFVPLAPLSSGEFLVPAVAHALGFSFFRQKEQKPAIQLLNYLREKEMLLLLDNFEHLLGVTPYLADLLAEAPGLKLLVTSRERLNLRGEWAFPVAGMSFPVDGDLGSVEDYSAVRLFLQAARQVDINFSLPSEEVEGLLRICRLVEGMPLALELAAAWVRLLSCPEIAAEIEHGLDFLAVSARDRPDRHQSLRAVFDHSWRLLSDGEQRAFSRLSVCRGGFDRDAARAVAEANLLLLSGLADKSLLQRQATGRYGIHELLRQYAADKLAADPEEQAATRARHGRHYLGFLHGLEDRLKGGGQREATDEIAAEIENLRVAWQWAVSGSHAAEIRRAAFSLGQFYEIRSRWQEGEEAFRQAVAALEPSPADPQSGDRERNLALGLCLVFWGRLVLRLYRLDEAEAIFQRSLEVLQPLGEGPELALAQLMSIAMDESSDLEALMEQVEAVKAVFVRAGEPWGAALALLLLGELASYGPESSEAARRSLQASYDASRQIGDEVGMAACLFDLADLAQRRGEWALAYARYDESLAIRRELGDGWGIAYCLDCMGYLAREMGEFDEARRLHGESLALSRQIGDQLGVAGSIDNLGLVARDEGDYLQAHELVEQALALRREVGRAWDIIHSLQHRAELAFALGDYEEARAGFQECLDRCEPLGWHTGETLARLGLGAVAAATADGPLARQHLRAVLDFAWPSGGVPLILNAAAVMIGLLIEEDRWGLAAHLLALVQTHPASSEGARRRAVSYLEALRARVPDMDLEPALTPGLNQVLYEALQAALLPDEPAGRPD